MGNKTAQFERERQPESPLVWPSCRHLGRRPSFQISESPISPVNSPRSDTKFVFRREFKGVTTGDTGVHLPSLFSTHSTSSLETFTRIPSQPHGPQPYKPTNLIRRSRVKTTNSRYTSPVQYGPRNSTPVANPARRSRTRISNSLNRRIPPCRYYRLSISRAPYRSKLNSTPRWTAPPCSS